MSSSLSVKERLVVAAKAGLDQAYREILDGMEEMLKEGSVQSPMIFEGGPLLTVEYAAKRLTESGISAMVSEDPVKLTVDVSFLMEQLRAEINPAVSVLPPPKEDLMGWIRIDCDLSPFGGKVGVHRRWLESELTKRNLQLLPQQKGTKTASFLVRNDVDSSEPLVCLQFKVCDRIYTGPSLRHVWFQSEHLDAWTHRRLDDCLLNHRFRFVTNSLTNGFKPETGRIKLHFNVQ